MLRSKETIHMQGTLYKFTMAICAGTVLLGAVPAAAQAVAVDALKAAQSLKNIRFDIPAQALETALLRFSEQAGIQLVVANDTIKGIKAPAVRGEYSTNAALTLLLQGSGLGYRVTDERTIAISSVKSKNLSGSADDSMTLSDERARDVILLAGVEEESKTQDKKSQSSKSGQAGTVEEMVVEGERDKPVPFSTANLDLTRTEDDVLPFTVFTAKDIQLSGAASVDEFLRTRLTQATTPLLAGERVGSLDEYYYGTQLDMRGWGRDETVFLVNGRRMSRVPRRDWSAGVQQPPNLDSIPLGSIERIEILTSAGSAIYGANATGGVVNIITRQDFQGGALALSYESPADAHAPKTNVSMNYGMPLPWDMSLRLTGGYNESDPLTVGDRANVAQARWRQRVLQLDPTLLLNRTSQPPLGATPNIRTRFTTSADTLFGVPGTANFTTVPNGYTGGGGLSAFQPGVYNLDLPEGAGGSVGKATPYGAFNTNVSFGAGIDKRLGKQWRWSLDYLYSENISDMANHNDMYFAYSDTRVPANAAINPFGQEVVIKLLDPGLDRPGLKNTLGNVDWSLSSTLHGSMGEWQGFWDLSYSRNRNDSWYSRFAEPYGGWINAFMTGAYNPFVDYRAVSPAAPGFYEHYISFNDHFASSSDQYQTSLKVSGPLLRVPAGAVNLTAGIDWSRFKRDKSLADVWNYADSITGQPAIPVSLAQYYPPGADIGYYVEPNGARFSVESSAAYAEINLPLISGAQGIPLVEKLEFFASGRLARLKTDGFRNNNTDLIPFSSTDTSDLFAVGMGYEIVEGVAFRISQSVGFKPPTAQDLWEEDINPQDNITVDDHVRGEFAVPLMGTQHIGGGRLDLAPETTTSKNFGLVFSPTWASGLRVSIDYLHSIRNDAISWVGPQTMIDLESDFPGTVVRGAPDGNPSGVGPILFIDHRTVNFLLLSAKSIDFTVDKRFKNIFGGNFLVTAAASKSISFEAQTSTTAPLKEYVRSTTDGGYDTFNRLTRWNANTQLLWEGQRWRFGWNAQFFDWYYAPTYASLALQGSDRIPWKVNHDMVVGYNFAKQQNSRGMQRALSGTSLAFGVKNVFDREPRFFAPNSYGVAPFDSIAGRTVWLQMRKDFD